MPTHYVATALLVVLALTGCKSKDGAAQSAQTAPAAVASTASPGSAVASATSSAANVDEPVPADFAFFSEMSLGEGKAVPLPTYTKADKEELKAHQTVLQSEFEDLVKGGCEEEGKRFNVSWAPATYIFCRKDRPRGDEPIPTEWRMLAVQAHWASVIPLARSSGDLLDRPHSYEMMTGSRGWLFEIYGDGTVSYVLRGEGPQTVSCIARGWKDAGTIHDYPRVPDLPMRGADLDGDGKSDFPAILFRSELRWLSLAKGHLKPVVDGACNIANDVVSVDVEGAATWDGEQWSKDVGAFRRFYEHKLSEAKARVQRQRAAFGLAALTFGPGPEGAGETGPKPVARFKSLRDGVRLTMTNECAIDVAQAAAEVFVYERALGSTSDDAIGDADRVMRGFALRPAACAVDSGPLGKTSTSDGWSDVRADLLRFVPPKLPEALAPVASASASASALASSSAAPSALPAPAQLPSASATASASGAPALP